jgi:hypothetical protein
VQEGFGGERFSSTVVSVRAVYVLQAVGVFSVGSIFLFSVIIFWFGLAVSCSFGVFEGNSFYFIPY